MSLKDIIARQQAAKAATTRNGSPSLTQQQGSNNEGDTGGPAVESGAVDNAPAAPAVVSKPRLGFVSAAPKHPTQVTSSAPSVVEQKTMSQTVVSLDDISMDDGVVPSVNQIDSAYAFADEISAQAPTRELPADLTKQQEGFVQQLDSIYEILHDPELFGQMIRTIMQELQESPDHINLMADQDVHTMIRGLRSSMGLARIKKAEKATKTRGSKKAPATTALAGTLDELYGSEEW